MKKKHFLIAFSISALCFTNAYSQQADSLKQVKINSFRKDLDIDKGKAEKVVLIMDSYKEKAKALIADKTISEGERRTKLNLLIDEKNTGLKKLLNEKQLEKIIPSTERQKDDSSKNNG